MGDEYGEASGVFMRDSLLRGKGHFAVGCSIRSTENVETEEPRRIGLYR